MGTATLIGWVLAFVALGALYAAANAAGVALVAVEGINRAPWPPTALALGALAVLGARAWPAVLLGIFLFHTVAESPAILAMALSAADFAQAVVGALVLRRFVRHEGPFRSASNGARYLGFVAGASTVVSATLSVPLLAGWNLVPWGDVGLAWLLWWAWDVVGALTVTPLVLAWHPDPRLHLTRGRLVEFVAMISVTAVVAFFAFSVGPLAYFVLAIPYVWPVVRFGAKETTLNVAVTSAASAIAVSEGLADAPLSALMPILYAQGYLVLPSASILLVLAFFAEWKRLTAALNESRIRLERKVQERTAALQTANVRFSSFMKDLPGLAWIKEPTGRYVYCNDKFAETLSTTPEAVAGKTDPELFEPSIAEEFQKNDRTVVKNGKSIQIIEPQPTPGGKRTSLVHKFPIFNESGQLAFVGGVAVDVTDRLEAQARLEASEAKLREAQRIAGLGSWEWDVRSGDITWSPELKRMFGRAPEDYDDPYSAILESVHPDDRERVNNTVQEAARRGQDVELECRVRRADGSVRRVLVNATSVRDETGASIRVLGTAQDLTERTEAERWFRQLVDAAPDPIIILGAGKVIEYLNHQAETTFGYARSELLNEPLESLLHGGLDDVAGKPGEATQDQPKATTRRTIRRRDGTEIPVDISASRLETSRGPVTVAAIRDISDRIAAERAREEAQRRKLELENLRRINKLKTEFINTAAHELRTPLSPMVTQMYLLSKEADKHFLPEQRKGLDMLNRNMKRLQDLVEDLLESARFQASRLSVEPVEADLHDTVASAVQSYRQNFEAQGKRVVLGTRGPSVFRHDPKRMTQVLFNLLGNALKFTKPGDRVVVDCSVTKEAAFIRVEDDGIGMDPKAVSRLFQPFTQVHDTTKVKSSGPGLGLYIARGIVEAHGGQISAASEGLGRGSRFQILLPAVDPGRPAVPPADWEQADLEQRQQEARKVEST